MYETVCVCVSDSVHRRQSPSICNTLTALQPAQGPVQGPQVTGQLKRLNPNAQLDLSELHNQKGEWHKGRRLKSYDLKRNPKLFESLRRMRHHNQRPPIALSSPRSCKFAFLTQPQYTIYVYIASPATIQSNSLTQWFI